MPLLSFSIYFCFVYVSISERLSQKKKNIRCNHFKIYSDCEKIIEMRGKESCRKTETINWKTHGETIVDLARKVRTLGKAKHEKLGARRSARSSNGRHLQLQQDRMHTHAHTQNKYIWANVFAGIIAQANTSGALWDRVLARRSDGNDSVCLCKGVHVSTPNATAVLHRV